MTRTHRLIAALLALALIAGLATPAAAQTDTDGEGGFLDALLTEGDQGADGWVVDLGRSVAETVTEVTSAAARTFTAVTTDAGEADQYANQTAEVLTANNVTLETYANARLNASTDYDVFAVEFTDRSGETATWYVLADVVNGSYTDLQMVESTDRTVDETVELGWYASRNAAGELETFLEAFASQDRDVSTTYRAELLARYGGDITSTLWTANETTEDQS